jgi:hypothetical protein
MTKLLKGSESMEYLRKELGKLDNMFYKTALNFDVFIAQKMKKTNNYPKAASYYEKAASNSLKLGMYFQNMELLYNAMANYSKTAELYEEIGAVFLYPEKKAAFYKIAMENRDKTSEIARKLKDDVNSISNMEKGLQNSIKAYDNFMACKEYNKAYDIALEGIIISDKLNLKEETKHSLKENAINAYKAGVLEKLNRGYDHYFISLGLLETATIAKKMELGDNEIKKLKRESLQHHLKYAYLKSNKKAVYEEVIKASDAARKSNLNEEADALKKKALEIKNELRKEGLEELKQLNNKIKN